MTMRDAPGWQLILADLALILFLVTVAALTRTAESDEARREREPQSKDGASIAPAQALYRPGATSPTIESWLDSQTIDPRATLSVIATHREGDAEAAWKDAQALASKARARGIPVRVVVMQADQTDLYASLAYDTPR